MLATSLIARNEDERLKALRELGVLDTPREADFDDIVKLAASICEAPASLITLVDEKRQWFKAATGIDISETSRDLAFCTHALDGADPLVVEDARNDQRFASNPLVTGAPGIRFYAGAPLRTPSGHVVGTLCVIDYVARKLSPHQLESLSLLSRLAVAEMEIRRLLRNSQEAQRMVAIEAKVLEAVSMDAPIEEIFDLVATVVNASVASACATVVQFVDGGKRELISGDGPEMCRAILAEFARLAAEPCGGEAPDDIATVDLTSDPKWRAYRSDAAKCG